MKVFKLVELVNGVWIRKDVTPVESYAKEWVGSRSDRKYITVYVATTACFYEI